MSGFTYPVGLMVGGGVAEEKILVTMTPTAGYTVGFNLTFTGSASIDFKDGGGIEPLTSGVEETHLYAGAGTYIAEITEDLENITKFIADNSKIAIIDNFKTGLLTDLRLWGNLLTTLDLGLAPISGTVWLFNNSNLASITFASSGNSVVTSFVADNCNLSIIDISNVPISTTFSVINNTGLTSIAFASSGNGKIANFDFFNCNLLSLNFANINVGGGTFRASNNSNLASITFASSGNTKLTAFRAALCNLLSLDLSSVPIGTTFEVNNNTLLASITFASLGNTIVSKLIASTCNLSSLDLSNLPISGQVDISFNSNLASITFAGSGNAPINIFTMQNCNLPNIDFTIFGLNNSCTISQINNAFSSTEHDNQIINIDNTGAISGNLAILAGNNARTAASDTAYNSLIAKGWVIT